MSSSTSGLAKALQVAEEEERQSKKTLAELCKTLEELVKELLVPPKKTVAVKAASSSSSRMTRSSAKKKLNEPKEEAGHDESVKKEQPTAAVDDSHIIILLHPTVDLIEMRRKESMGPFSTTRHDISYFDHVGEGDCLRNSLLPTLRIICKEHKRLSLETLALVFQALVKLTELSLRFPESHTMFKALDHLLVVPEDLDVTESSLRFASEIERKGSIESTSELFKITLDDRYGPVAVSYVETVNAFLPSSYAWEEGVRRHGRKLVAHSIAVLNLFRKETVQNAPSVELIAKCISFVKALCDWDSRELFTRSFMEEYGAGFPMFAFMARDHAIERQRLRNTFFQVQSPLRYMYLQVLNIFMQSQAFFELDARAQVEGIQTVLDITKIDRWRSIVLEFDMINIIKFVLSHGQPATVAPVLRLANIVVKAAYSEKEKRLNLSAISEIVEPLYRAHLPGPHKLPGGDDDSVTFIIEKASVQQLMAVVEHTELVSALILERFSSDYVPGLGGLIRKIGFSKCLETIQSQERNNDKISLLTTYRDILQQEKRSNILRFKAIDEFIIRILVAAGWNRLWLIRAWFPEVPSQYDSWDVPELINSLETLIIMAARSSLPRLAHSSWPGASIWRKLPQFLFMSNTA